MNGPAGLANVFTTALTVGRFAASCRMPSFSFLAELDPPPRSETTLLISFFLDGDLLVGVLPAVEWRGRVCVCDFGRS